MTSLEVMMKNAGSSMRKQRRAHKVFKARQQRCLRKNKERLFRERRRVLYADPLIHPPVKPFTKHHPAKRRASRSTA